ncbi:hypothetical protein BH11PSE9_BH11PSE9_31760 [soil metagenome]
MFVLPLSRVAHSAAHRAALAPQFNRAVDRLFEQSFDRILRAAPTAEPVRTPAMDVSETDTAYTVVLDVPGATREQLKVSVEGRRVSVETVAVEPVAAQAAKVDTINADATADATAAPQNAPQAAAPAAPRVLYRERTAANFARTVSLPTEVDQTASQARFDNGVLTLTLAKKVPTGATRLTVA